jgi:hypothetical protein
VTRGQLVYRGFQTATQQRHHPELAKQIRRGEMCSGRLVGILERQARRRPGDHRRERRRVLAEERELRVRQDGCVPVGCRALEAHERGGITNRKGRNTIRLKNPKAATLTPMPIARMTTATAAKPGDRRMVRAA